jgi:hypothetical protein
MRIPKLCRGSAFYMTNNPMRFCKECDERIFITKLTRRKWCKKCREYKDIELFQTYSER